MNTFHDLLDRYATASGLRVDAREWLMLLELDPARAVTAMTHLAALAATDQALSLTGEALDTLGAATNRPDAPQPDVHLARTRAEALAERMAAVRHRAWQAWTEEVLPLLREADVLTPARPQQQPRPRRWMAGQVTLPGHAGRYPARIATRRHVEGSPVAGLDAETCRRAAADLAASGRPVPALILVDRDRPVLVIGARDLESAWRSNAALCHADPDGYYWLGRGWHWHAATETSPHPIPATATPVSHRRPAQAVPSWPTHRDHAAAAVPGRLDQAA